MSHPPYEPRHEPVLLHETLAALDVRPGGSYIDATLGLGGHAEAILEAAQPDGRLLGIDRDPAAIEVAGDRLARFGEDAVLVEGNYEQIADIAEDQGFSGVDGVLFDLGVSSMQLDAPGRGFSFQRDEPLDMRMGPDARLSAADIVNTYDEAELADLIWKYGEERRSRAIARSIVARRPIDTTGALVNAIEQAVGRGRERQIHPATLTFQALRIAVNGELSSLEDALEGARGLLAGVGSRLVVISFHSLEDRIVKRYMIKESSTCVCPPRTPVCICGKTSRLRLSSKRAVQASEGEIARNPRARSARLRVAESVVERRAA
ncbi:MAG: 16S rRNA (cytosine(1402)-N(4))-methyltransferase RsmH [Dehalococcoidia bacterium]|mgnify:CR=1 FL=1|nr:16S rRNA (cytosine(1402)-N(4))-methyltransferase RsmH [Dehalococcoidia bacterium]HRC61933.1 16S rRNA (cytosine(1402)-N(4))-methyltransferase RsmH [Dehalococcoidia bacterium]